ncbi:VanZ family protein [Bacillus sp. PS06]|uniref:VanZ family protein n=1 Tax=Bacillus sp. PS06 TaxID=2764176 RepID=UPI001782B8E8|nr:VanZ family protein [Bacillus sp. PS06]MBD8069577.1 VanZ family protein [Bacillus sp. PS06]
MKIIIKVFLSIALSLYLIILTKLVLIKYIPLSAVINHLTFSFDFDDYYWNSHNFIPFKTITYYLFLANDINFNIRVENLTGNVIGFVPFGFLLPLLFRNFRSLKNVTFATFCLSLLFEVLQLIFRFGSFDIDDLILNTLGGMLGYIPISFFLKCNSRRKVEQKSVMY